MRLNEIFEDVSPADIKRVELALDKFTYQPNDAIEKDKPVLDVEIPSKETNHFIQRLNQRGEKAQINLGQIFNLLKTAKTDPSLGYAQELDALSKENNPHDDVVIKSKERFNPIVLPVLVKPNPAAKRFKQNNPVALDATGHKVPKNQLVPKTVFRKGIDD